MKLIYILSLGIFLTGCVGNPLTFEPKTQVQIVTTTNFPVLPDIKEPTKPKLKKFKIDYPRDKEGKIIPQSNIFAGVDQEAFNALTYNLELLKEDNNSLRQRLRLSNKQRQEWRIKAEEEKKRVAKQKEELLKENKIILE
jgi:hypothetical protein